MICFSCGKEIDEDSKFCPECGARIRRNEPDTFANSGSRPVEEIHNPKNSGKPAPKWPLVVLPILIVAVLGFLIYAVFGVSSRNKITPYGVEWGDTPEMVMKKDQAAKMGGENNKGELTVRDETFYGVNFNMRNDAIDHPLLLYRFTEDKLGAITFICGINTSVISSDDFINEMIECFSKKYRSQPVSESIYYLWSSKDCSVKLCYITDDIFTIEYTP